MVFLFSQKVSCHANDLENEVHCLLHCPVFPNTVPATIFPPKCDVNTLEYKGDSFLRSRGYFSKYCSCHSAIGAEFLVAYLVSKYCAAGARNFLQQKPVLPSTAPATVQFFTAETRPPKYCSCHSAIGAEFLVAYLVSKYCAAGARNFLQQKPVLPSTAPATVQFFTAETRPPKYCSCHSAIGAEFLVAYLLSKYCAAGARIFLQQKPVLPSTAPATVLLGHSFW